MTPAMKACPVSPSRECRDDTTCDGCLPFLCVCDECTSAGHIDSEGWHMVPDGRLLCDVCYRTPAGLAALADAEGGRE